MYNYRVNMIASEMIVYGTVKNNTEMKDKLDIPCPIYMNRTDFDFETDQPWILSLRPSFQLKWSDNNRYEGQDE